MRLLGWMHNKLRHTTIEPFKDFTIGNYCACLSAKPPLDDKVSHVKPRFGSIYEECENTLSEVEAKTVHGNYEDETSMVMSEIFHGFLAIGTLGSKPFNSEPVTPTFPMSLGNITDENGEVTENDLKLINDELEKFFEAEAEEEGSIESLARSSYVSTIKLSGMQMEGAHSEEYGKAASCPLQGYLFGSTIELTETKAEIKKEKTSLGEMFRRTKIADEVSAETEEKGDMQTKQEHKFPRNLIKKMLGKFHGSSRNPAPSRNHAAISVSTRKKLNKVLRVFHRKVHPENAPAEKEFAKYRQEKIEKTLHHNAAHVPQHGDNGKSLLGPNSIEERQSYDNNLKLSCGLSSSNSSGNKEHWIKTDADYLVLEL